MTDERLEAAVSSMERPVVSPDQLDTVCCELLGSSVAEVLFEAGYSSAVFGVRLTDGRQVVLKWRRWRDRLVSCYRVHRDLWAGGFACPEPLTAPLQIGGLAVSVEALLPGGESLGRGEEAAARLAGVLAALVAAAPAPATVGPLEPDMGLLRWNHPARALWPRATDVAADLNAGSGAPWLEDCAHAVRRRLARVEAPAVVGHGDWWSDNVRWADGCLHAVDDWDSIVALPEATLVGAAAALHAGGVSSMAETEAFLESYVTASRRQWSQEDHQVAWAAGLWARLFDARKELTLGSSSSAERLRPEAAGRAERAGL